MNDIFLTIQNTIAEYEDNYGNKPNLIFISNQDYEKSISQPHIGIMNLENMHHVKLGIIFGCKIHFINNKTFNKPFVCEENDLINILRSSRGFVDCNQRIRKLAIMFGDLSYCKSSCEKPTHAAVEKVFLDFDALVVNQYLKDNGGFEYIRKL